MKKLFISLTLILGLFGAVASVSAEQIAWQIIGHDLSRDKLKVDIARNANRGFVPMGISFYDQKLFVLYLHGEGLEIQGWNLEWYLDSDELAEGLNRNIEDGYNPSGIADAGDLFFVMYIKTTGDTLNWDFVQTPIKLDRYSILLQPSLAKVFIPVGITEMYGEYWTLVIQNKGGGHAKMTQLEKFPSDNDSINKGVINKVTEGMLPWGLMYNGDSVTILFVRF